MGEGTGLGEDVCETRSLGFVYQVRIRGTQDELRGQQEWPSRRPTTNGACSDRKPGSYDSGLHDYVSRAKHYLCTFVSVL